MPSNDMIERVARAIYEGRNGPRCTPWAHQPKAHQEPYLKDARAAIEAMREPTSLMVRNAEKAMLNEYRPKKYKHHVSCSRKHRIRYSAMIEGALGNKLSRIDAALHPMPEE